MKPGFGFFCNMIPAEPHQRKTAAKKVHSLDFQGFGYQLHGDVVAACSMIKVHVRGAPVLVVGGRHHQLRGE